MKVVYSQFMALDHRAEMAILKSKLSTAKNRASEAEDKVSVAEKVAQKAKEVKDRIQEPNNIRGQEPRDPKAEGPSLWV